MIWIKILLHFCAMLFYLFAGCVVEVNTWAGRLSLVLAMPYRALPFRNWV